MFYQSRYIQWANSSTLFKVASMALPLCGLTSLFVTPYMTMATLAYVLMSAGVIFRRERIAHARLMGTAIFIDLALVIILQIQRSAIQVAIGFELSWLEKTHILFSLLAVILYVPMIYLGLLRYRNKATSFQKTLHHRLGIFTFIFRTLGFVFMFSMLK